MATQRTNIKISTSELIYTIQYAHCTSSSVVHHWRWATPFHCWHDQPHTSHQTFFGRDIKDWAIFTWPQTNPEKHSKTVKTRLNQPITSYFTPNFTLWRSAEGPLLWDRSSAAVVYPERAGGSGESRHCQWLFSTPWAPWGPQIAKLTYNLVTYISLYIYIYISLYIYIEFMEDQLLFMG